MASILLIDDEETIRYSFQRVFASEQTQVVCAGTSRDGLDAWRQGKPDVVVLDLQLPDGTGLEVYRQIRAANSKVPVIFITAHGTTETAIEAMKGGAFDYLVKPVDLSRMTTVLERALEAARLMRVPAVLPSEDAGDRIVGRSPAIQEMSKNLGRIAPQDVNVLVQGESGTGKELVARALYHHSRRADRTFLAINCAAVAEHLLESELFGHEVGAFTGATRRHIGRFEQSDGGTLFFDEIGDMSLPLQAKLLRVVQEQRFERVGGSETIQTDVRLLAATNQDLDTLVQRGRFRADLYYRLKAVTIHVPPLRDRPGDVAELASYFLFRFNRKLGLDFRGFSPDALVILEGYHWPGNVRELMGVLQHAMLHGSGHILTADLVEGQLGASRAVLETGTDRVGLGLDHVAHQVMTSQDTDWLGTLQAEVERRLIRHALQTTGGHLTRASGRLGINRATLRTKMRQYGITLDTSVAEPDDDEGS